MTATITFLNSNFRDVNDIDLLDKHIAALKQHNEENTTAINDIKTKQEDELQALLNELDQVLARVSSKSVEESLQGIQDIKIKIQASDFYSAASTSRLNVATERLERLIEAQQLSEKLRVIYTLSMDIEKLVVEKKMDQAILLYTDLFSAWNATKDLIKSESSKAVLTIVNDATHTFNATWNNLKTEFEESLRNLLSKISWPKPTSTVADMSLLDQFTKSFNALLTLQIETDSDSVLLPFSVLAEAIDLRFRYHFESQKETNRPDKPEWVFQHFIKVVDEHASFLSNVVQPILRNGFLFSDRSAINEFITAVLPSVRRKIFSLFPRVADMSTSLLSHLIFEVCTFDKVVSEKYMYTQHGTDKWIGLSGQLFEDKLRFERWLEAEKEIAFGRYQQIIDTPKAFNIEYEGVDYHETKPTNSAINIKFLLENLTTHYASLESVTQKLRYLMDIQVTILDRYYSRLNNGLEIIESMGSTLSRAVGGISSEDSKKAQGLAGLERLCRIYGSANFIEESLKTWGEDLFFFALWEEMSELLDQAGSVGNLDQDILDSASSSSTNLPSNKTGQTGNDTLFDETASSYGKLEERAVVQIRALIKKEIQSSMKDYFLANTWPTIISDEDSQFDIIEPSRELQKPIKVIAPLIKFLNQFFSLTQYHQTLRLISSDVEMYIWTFIIKANKFSQFGGRQLLKDIQEIWQKCGLPIDIRYRRLVEAANLLMLPDTDTVDGKLDFKNILKLVISGPEGETEAYNLLGMSELTVGELRELVQRRV